MVVDNSIGSTWGIINTVTGKTKKIGLVKHCGINYFDRAKAEAGQRNMLLLIKALAT
ncbi:hypothetical protein [Propionivibrio sp.]|uniref:hypothetical protein n=1 Tax=Propionivibrio sp. TaxID=2212460 RepID=UPI003BF47011